MPTPPLHDWRSRITDSAGSPRLKASGTPVADVLRELIEVGSIDAVRCASSEDVRACLLYLAESLPEERAVEDAEVPTLEEAEVATLEPVVLEAVTLSPTPTSEAATVAPTGETLSGDRRVNVPGYEILGELGRGGMGVVYKARQVRLDRVVALKMILAGEHAGEDALARFQREAEVVARVQHPGIVQIHEIGESSGHSFLALEFVAGGSLASRLDQTPWKAEDAAALVEKVARAVHFAHERGVVHRDLKPENILLDENDEPKVADFGLAKRLEETGQTKTGDVMGTPSYMAPEQAAGRKEIGPAADVYALGGILHRLLAGHPLFEGATTLDILMRVLGEEPVPLRQLNAKVPRDLETIALKCLAKEPEKRYASAAALGDDLQRYLDGEPIRARQMTSAERLFRFVRKHPTLAMCRGLVILLPFRSLMLSPLARELSLFGMVSALGEMLLQVVLLAAWLHAPRRRLLLSMSICVPLAVLLGVERFTRVEGFTIRTAKRSRVFQKILRQPIWSADSVAVLAPLPVWVGLGIAVSQRRPWRAFLISLGLFALGTLLANSPSIDKRLLNETLLWSPGFIGPQFKTLNAATIVITVAACVIGLIVRLIRLRWEGNGWDIVCGLLTGSLLGFTLLSYLLVPFLSNFMHWTDQNYSRGIGNGVLLATLACGLLGAIWAAKYTERMSKPQSRLGGSA